MIPNQNYEIYASLSFYFLTKFLCYWFGKQMHGKRELASIPEKNENEEEQKVTKWVPKKKHEVLKAKYKCLKKLFQIYDASVIGILPDPYNDDAFEVQEKTHRRKRSHRTKTDACAGTTEVSSGDVTEQDDKSTIATAVIRDLKIQCSCSTQMITAASEQSNSNSKFKDSITQDSKETLNSSERECECTQTADVVQHPIPYLRLNEKRKLTRFQSFIQRIFGIKPEKTYRNYVLPNGHIYASSDNNITHHYCGGRRRRRLRFRRLRKPRKIVSESALRDMRSPVILTYVQSVQRSCLMDTTPRQCPIVGCRMISYGIINYNDHLNLCHFTDRKFICHYCHEGFEREYDKYLHENEHLGITKLNLNNLSATSTARPSFKKASHSNTQTDPQLDVPEEKLKKIVSFFDKIVDNEQFLSEIKKKRYSESNLQTLQSSSKAESETVTDDSMTNSSDKRTASCGNLLHRKAEKSKTTVADSEVTSKFPASPVKCHFCGENFDYRRQLSLHVDLEHRVHDKFSKFHSCAGITSPGNKRVAMATDDGICILRGDLQRVNTSSTLTQDSFEVCRRKSEETLSCDPSTNIIYYESVDPVGKKPSVINSIVQKVRSGITSYKWEPGTKIIRI